jgi:hypothetical protein
MLCTHWGPLPRRTQYLDSRTGTPLLEQHCKFQIAKVRNVVCPQKWTHPVSHLEKVYFDAAFLRTLGMLAALRSHPDHCGEERTLLAHRADVTRVQQPFQMYWTHYQTTETQTTVELYRWAAPQLLPRKNHLRFPEAQYEGLTTCVGYPAYCSTCGTIFIICQLTHQRCSPSIQVGSCCTRRVDSSSLNFI